MVLRLLRQGRPFELGAVELVEYTCPPAERVGRFGLRRCGMGLTEEGRNGVTAVAPLGVYIESICASGHLGTARLDNVAPTSARLVISAVTIADRCFCGARLWHHVQTRPSGIPTPSAGMPAQSDEDGPKTLRGAGVSPPPPDPVHEAVRPEADGLCPSCPPVEIVDDA